MIRQLLLNPENKDKIAVIDGNKNILYRDLTQKALALNPYLPIGQMANIAIFLPNSSDYIATLFGIFMLGLTAFPLNTSMTQYEILPLLKQVSAHTVITTKTFDWLFEEIQICNLPNLQIIYIEDLSPVEYSVPPVIINITTTDPLVLLTTSGSTGRVRIVPLTEMNVEASTLGYLDKMDFKHPPVNDVRYILATPFSTAYGLMILSACLMNSFPIILLGEGFTLDAFYKTAAKHKATHYEGGTSLPLLMARTASKIIPYDINLLRHFGFGGSKVSGDTLRLLQNAHPSASFWQGYGMTEAAPLITKYANTKSQKLDSVGTAIKGIEIAIVADGTVTNTPYMRGEIIAKGPNVMLGYYQNEVETNKVLKNGYLYTGDIGYLDEDGYLYICGRKKNVIIVRGFNVYPEEVESCILNSSLAKECIAYGETDIYGNEIVCADIVPINSDVQIEAIKSYCQTHLSRHKQPQKVQFVTTIKKVPSGKIARGLEDSQ